MQPHAPFSSLPSPISSGSLSVAAGIDPTTPFTISPSVGHALILKVLSDSSTLADTYTPNPNSSHADSPISPIRQPKVILLADFLDSHPPSDSVEPTLPSSQSDYLATETFIDAAETDSDAASSEGTLIVHCETDMRNEF